MTTDYATGDIVRLTQSIAAAEAGTEGTVVRVIRDAHDTVTALNVLIDGDLRSARGTTVFPHEVEVVRRRAHADDTDR